MEDLWDPTRGARLNLQPVVSWVFGWWEIWRSVCCGNTVDGSGFSGEKTSLRWKISHYFLRGFYTSRRWCRVFVPSTVFWGCQLCFLLRAIIIQILSFRRKLLLLWKCATMFCFKEYFAVICAENVADWKTRKMIWIQKYQHLICVSKSGFNSTFHSKETCGEDQIYWTKFLWRANERSIFSHLDVFKDRFFWVNFLPSIKNGCKSSWGEWFVLDVFFSQAIKALTKLNYMRCLLDLFVVMLSCLFQNGICCPLLKYLWKMGPGSSYKWGGWIRNNPQKYEFFHPSYSF